MLVPLLLVVATAVAVFTRLDQPDRIYFDETYYVEDARNLLDQGVEDGFPVHPPVGKWLIGAGIVVFGDNPFGWRAAGAAAGVAIVLLTYLIGARLLSRRGLAALAALLVATDGLLFTQARIAMLDIFLALFVVLGAWLLLVDRTASGLDGGVLPARAVPSGGAGPPPASGTQVTDPPRAATAGGARAPGGLPRRRHPWRFAAGVAFGLAVATKWSGVLALGAAGLLVLGWELAARRRLTGRFRTRLWAAVGSVAVTLVLVPAGVYALSYVPWLVNFADTSEGREACEADPCEAGLAERLEGLVDYHAAVWRFHVDLEADHPYRSPPYSWPVLARPVVYHWETCPQSRADRVPSTGEDGEVTIPDPCVVAQGQASEVIGLGNPVLWYAFLPASALLVAGLARRDHRAAFPLAFWAAQFVPWLPFGRPQFLFYMAPAVPFLALGVGLGVAWLVERQRVAGTLVGAAGGGALGFGAGYLLAGTVAVTDPWLLRWVALGVGWVVGAVVGDRIDLRREDRHAGAGRSGRPAGVWVGVAVAVLAVALFVYFYPVLSALPLPEEAVRQRWWLRPGWI